MNLYRTFKKIKIRAEILKPLCLYFFILQFCVWADSSILTNRSNATRLIGPPEKDVFSFVIFGARAHTLPWEIEILKRAVNEVNVLSPDLVFSLGDMTGGDNSKQWFEETANYKNVISALHTPWFPVAGNRDVCWEGASRPSNEHERDYEHNFGPLWYTFEYKDCWFIVLYTDEGNPDTGRKDNSPSVSHTIGPKQTEFLSQTLKKAQGAMHVFVFLHHPCWHFDRYGYDWQRIHELLVEAGNVSACFAGDNRRLKYDGMKDGIQYYTVGSTGGSLPGEIQDIEQGNLHHYTLVTVDNQQFHINAFPVGAISDMIADVMIYTILKEEKWIIDQAERRTLVYPIHIPDCDGVHYILRIGVSDGEDSSGDKGVNYQLQLKDGTILEKGFMDRNDYQWVKSPVQSGQELLFSLTDRDTDLKGRSPGNGGKIRIELDVQKQTGHDNRTDKNQ